MYAANALLPPPFWPLVPLVSVAASSEPPHAAVKSMATETAATATARRGAFQLITGTGILLKSALVRDV
ncbi:hypothetical protein Aph02nite_06430 [Actinoplanes philippinensis]|nr:hypothetical protein Aph02nite_06430 [Actinoplanes philippinensis]